MRLPRLAVFFPLLTQLACCASAIAPERVVLESTARYTELIELLEEQSAESSETTAASLYNLCYAYSKVKNYTKLFECVDKFEARIKSGDTQVVLYSNFLGKSDGSPIPHLLRAEAFIELGQYEQAITQAEEAYRFAKGMANSVLGMEHTEHTIESLSLLARAYVLAGKPEKARQYLNALKDLSLPYKGSGQTEPMKNRALALVYVALGEFQSALDILKRGGGTLGRNFIKVFVGGGQNLYAWLELPIAYVKATCLLETGDTPQAKAALDKLLDNGQTRNVGEIYWLILYDRGRIAEQEGSSDAAIDFYRSAVEVIERQRASISTEANKIGFVGDKQKVYERLIRLLIRQGENAKAFDYVERSKSRALVDMLASKKDFAPSEVDSKRTSQIVQKVDNIDLAIRSELGGESQNAEIRDLQNVRLEIQSEVPELSSLLTVTSVPQDELRSMLEDGESLVEYYYAEHELYVFILTRGTLKAASLDASGLPEAIKRFREALVELNSTEWQNHARSLYDRLWAPIESMVDGKVTVVPHGVLHYLPFGILRANDGHYLIDQFGFRFLPSASVLKFLRPTLVDGGGSILVVGNPDLGDPRFNLKSAESEAAGISNMFPGSRLLVKREATETNFRRATGDFSRIHLATHGKFQPDEPLASGLFLRKDDENDGILTVSELYSMTLNADLVALSACETGLGKIGNGDDVVGLVRGFLYAGSRSVIASLWSVDDAATGLLMQNFYERLEELPKQEALRQAQLKVRQNYPHPFFWAAFQLTGRRD